MASGRVPNTSKIFFIVISLSHFALNDPARGAYSGAPPVLARGRHVAVSWSERAARFARSTPRESRTTGVLLISRHESSSASRLFLYSNIQTSRPATVSGSRCCTAPAVRDGMQTVRVSPRQSGAIHANTGQSHGPSTTSSDESRTHVVRPLRIESPIVEARCASLIRHFVQQTAARPIALVVILDGSTRHATSFTSHESTGGKCCECVTRVRNGVVASESGPSNPRAHEAHRHASRCTRHARRDAHHRAASHCQGGAGSADDSLHARHVHAATPIVRAFGGCAR